MVCPLKYPGYAYDGAGRLARITYPSGRTVDYTLDAMGRVQGIDTTFNAVTQGLVSGVTYQPASTLLGTGSGGLKGFLFGNGAAYSRSFDLDGRVSRIAGAATRDYAYDAASRLTALTDPGNPANNQGFGYDALDRLNSAALPGGVTQGYTYDAVGNRLSFTQNGVVTNHTHAATHHRLLALTGAAAWPTAAIFLPWMAT